MFKKAIVMSLLILGLVATASVLVHSSFSQGKSDTLPPGRWVISAHP